MNTPGLTESKAAVRRDVLDRVRVMTVEARSAGAAQASERLRQQRLWQRARHILMYAPTATELDIWPLVMEALGDGKEVALPQFDAAAGQYVACRIEDLKQDIVTGRYGIREPAGGCRRVPLNRLDLILVPGVAFDLQGRRLGRGRGFYDQMLAKPHGATCGVAFDEQIVRQLPVAPHDIVLNCILTPTRWVEV